MNYVIKKKFPVPVSQEEVSQDWNQRGYSCGLFIDPPGREWNDFVHSMNEVVIVMEGQLRMTIEETDLIAEPGDEIFIPQGANHSVKNIHSGITIWLYGYD